MLATMQDRGSFIRSARARWLAVALLFACAPGKTTTVTPVPHAECPSTPAEWKASDADPSAPAADYAANDPVTTDGDKYTVILENDRVRVLRYRDQPGERTNSHHHPAFVLYALAPFERRLSFPDGTKKERAFVPGDVIFMPDQVHVGENTGSTPTDAVLVELKAGCAGAPPTP
jgi:quercetin dioxygenase-like cupin family protein